MPVTVQLVYRDSLCFIALEALAQRVEGSFNGLRVTFEGTLTPSILAVFVSDFDKQPAGKDPEVFDGLDLGHVGCVVSDDNAGK